MKKIKPILLSINVLLFSILFSISPALYAELAAKEQLIQYLEKVKTLKAVFTQTLFDERGMELQFSAGKFQLKKPGMFSWDYEEPYPQIIMSNGQNLWMYDSELEQVTVRQADATLTRTSLVLLYDTATLDEDFDIQDRGEIDGVDWLEMEPRQQDSDFNKILIGLNGGALSAIKLIDGFGQTTLLEFQNIVLNPSLDDAVFNFVVPPNVDVIGG